MKIATNENGLVIWQYRGDKKDAGQSWQNVYVVDESDIPDGDGKLYYKDGEFSRK